LWWQGFVTLIDDDDVGLIALGIRIHATRITPEAPLPAAESSVD
jgi:hypothetical protein